MEDTQGGTTPEGIHLGPMAGTVDLIQRGYTGIATYENTLSLNPCLPDGITALTMTIRDRGHVLCLRVRPDVAEVRTRASGATPIKISMRDSVYELKAGDTRRFRCDGSEI